MAEYEAEDGKAVCIWAQLNPIHTPRYVQAKIYRPDGALFATIQLTDNGDGYFNDTSLVYNGDNFWKVKLEVFTDNAYSVRDDDNYCPEFDYVWRSAGGSSGSVSIGSEITLTFEDANPVDLDYRDSDPVDLATENEDVSLSTENDESLGLEFDEPIEIELEYICEES